MMTLEQRILEDYKAAFKERNDQKKGILNYVVAQMKQKKIDSQKELTDDDVITVVKKEIKSRYEALEYLEKAEKTDDIAIEKANIATLEEYVPKSLSEVELRALVQETIASLGVTDIKADRGKITAAIMASHKSVVDGKMLSEIIVSMM